jgi:hypothetical protein
MSNSTVGDPPAGSEVSQLWMPRRAEYAIIATLVST